MDKNGKKCGYIPIFWKNVGWISLLADGLGDCLLQKRPFAFSNSAVRIAPPAAPRTVLCERPTNL